jgi:ubiquinone/menaquinone biosynthesis C-methylase UbiE
MARELKDQTEIIRQRYNRTALFYDWMDKMIPGSLRKLALSQALGKVLEVGVGTGQNLPYYPQGCEVTGIDFSPRMLHKAKARAVSAPVPVTLREMDAQNMEFPNEVFDSVIATCVFCSVPDPVKGLMEIRRVCKKSGKIILLEHVRSENPILGCLMDLLNPISLYVIGSNINRDTVQNVMKAGIDIQNIQNFKGNIIKLIIARS